eukprot:scaffold87323_cov20-Tisochrysis_lutea.AAC.1
MHCKCVPAEYGLGARGPRGGPCGSGWPFQVLAGGRTAHWGAYRAGLFKILWAAGLPRGSPSCRNVALAVP